MNVRQIMDCNFTLCQLHETTSSIVQKMINAKTFYVIVIDEKNTYRGVLLVCDLLKFKDFPVVPLEQVMQFFPPLKEEDSVHDIHPGNLDIVPVVNRMNTVVGVINIRSAFQHLPDILSALDSGRSSNSRRSSQINAKYTINDIVGQSRSILLLKEQILATAKTKSTIMILGETGTGKELVAHAIHRMSIRRHNAFVRINCAAIPDNLLESELFGYDQGAFTGAVKGGQIGKFEAADGGTIFLDEIGDMPLTLQAKILRVLQEKEIEKVGGQVPIPIDVRIIAATHHNLRELVKDRKFREDLYYRLHVIPIQIAPLREHREDIPMLVEYFLAKHAKELDIKKPAIDREYMTAMVEYDWPGNVRELANIVEMTISMSRGTITKFLLPSFMTSDSYQPPLVEDFSVLRNFSEQAEKEAIIKALDTFHGNKVKVCELLDISRSSLYNKLKKYNIEA